MEHISENKLLDYVAGKLADSESESVRRHMAQCPDCESRHHQTLDTWNLLGTWQVDTSAHQVADRLAVLVRQNETCGRPPIKAAIPWRVSMQGALRIAAAILIAAGAGHVLGRLTTASNEPTRIINTVKPRYLAALGFEWSSELTWTVLQDNAETGAPQP